MKLFLLKVIPKEVESWGVLHFSHIAFPFWLSVWTTQKPVIPLKISNLINYLNCIFCSFVAPVLMFLCMCRCMFLNCLMYQEMELTPIILLYVNHIKGCSLGHAHISVWCDTYVLYHVPLWRHCVWTLNLICYVLCNKTHFCNHLKCLPWAFTAYVYKLSSLLAISTVLI